MAGGVVLGGGCAAPSSSAPNPATPAPAAPVIPAQPAPQSQVSDESRFIIVPALQKVLRIASVTLTNAPGALLKFQINVQNLTDAPQRFSYRIEWFDKDGAPLPMASGQFTPWMLMPREVSSIVATAPTPTAADFGIAFVPPSN